ncbi:MAG: hypothetical protein ACE5E1_09630 [Phycisphaerae bacterium]
MDPRTNDMERLLVTLGEARQAGAFTDAATLYPWRDAEPVAQSPERRRFAWFWVGAPLAAAAAVAVLFVGPDLFSGAASRKAIVSVPTTLLTERPEAHADAAGINGQRLDDCDYNGDGVVNGLDIQALSDRRHDYLGDPRAEREYQRAAERLSRCLLGG